jgi:hypothetical protein
VFGYAEGTNRAGHEVAAMDAATGKLLPFAPDVEGQTGVWAMLAEPDGLRIAARSPGSAATRNAPGSWSSRRCPRREIRLGWGHSSPGRGLVERVQRRGFGDDDPDFTVPPLR